MEEAKRFKFEIGYWYPHMMPKDIGIWERFIMTYPGYFDECQYDVLVGSVPDFADPAKDPSNAGLDTLYRRKIDVVGWKDGQPYIVEVKPRAGTHAVGQVLGYIQLYERDYKPAVAPKPILLTDTKQEDIQIIADKYGVKLIVV